MSNELRDQIYNNMNLKETDELLEIWQTNDHVEWTDSTFEVIEELLLKRGVEIPERDEPVYEYDEEYGKELDEGSYKFSDVELKIIDDENPPDFYNPFEVIQLVKWIDWTTKAVVVVVILYNLVKFPTFMDMFARVPSEYQNSPTVYLLVFAAIAANILVGIAITNFLLKTLSQLLRILMTLEFNSRRVKS